MLMQILILISAATIINGFTINHSISPPRASFKLHASKTPTNSVGPTALTIAASLLFLSAPPAMADGDTKTFKFPPIDRSQPASTRCVLKSSAIGQSNAARDSLFDLRECQLSNSNAKGMDLSGVLLEGTDLSGSNFQDAVISKGYLHTTNFRGAGA
ncbi:hypothetical protein TL16_g05434 [Triparma laevis f. inornata]|uniref:Uncharacterized protein n=1 Tax=Triparma laevis f. inornata TaxID=1714386 RepID=A0A9W7EBX7_9STRA|nr:hypothetical protein TL16_g05434 [Triparma laevis f. inornata]